MASRQCVNHQYTFNPLNPPNTTHPGNPGHVHPVNPGHMHPVTSGSESRTARLMLHDDDNPDTHLSQAACNQMYPFVPCNLSAEIVYMLHWSRYLTPSGDFVNVHGNSTDGWPELRSNHYCRHCFLLQKPGQVCQIPCVNPCAVCGIHHSELPCSQAYNTSRSWHRSGSIPSETSVPSYIQAKPTENQFKVLQINGYIHHDDVFNEKTVPNFNIPASHTESTDYRPGREIEWRSQREVHRKGSQPLLGKLASTYNSGARPSRDNRGGGYGRGGGFGHGYGYGYGGGPGPGMYYQGYNQQSSIPPQNLYTQPIPSPMSGQWNQDQSSRNTNPVQTQMPPPPPPPANWASNASTPNPSHPVNNGGHLQKVRALFNATLDLAEDDSGPVASVESLARNSRFRVTSAPASLAPSSQTGDRRKRRRTRNKNKNKDTNEALSQQSQRHNNVTKVRKPAQVNASPCQSAKWTSNDHVAQAANQVASNRERSGQSLRDAEINPSRPMEAGQNPLSQIPQPTQSLEHLEFVHEESPRNLESAYPSRLDLQVEQFLRHLESTLPSLQTSQSDQSLRDLEP